MIDVVLFYWWIQNSLELARLQEQSDMIEELHNQLEKKKEENETLQSRLRFQQSTTVSQQIVLRLEAKIKELEAINEMEHTTSKHSEVWTLMIQCILIQIIINVNLQLPLLKFKVD